jgi:hypothetical protein
MPYLHLDLAKNLSVRDEARTRDAPVSSLGARNANVEGPGGVQASFDFRGAKNDVAGRMLTVTLTNDHNGTVYV